MLGNLLVEGLELDDGEVGIDFGESVARELFHVGDGSLSVDDQSTGVERSVVFDRILGAGRALHDGNKVHAMVFPANTLVDSVFDDADDFKVTGRVAVAAEMLTDGTCTCWKIILHEGLVHDGNGVRGGRVLGTVEAAHEELGADGIEIFRSDFDKRGAVAFGIGLTLDLDASAPVVVLHGSVGAEADIDDAGERVEALFDGAIESVELALGVSGSLGIDVDDVAIGRIEFELGGLEFGEATGEEAGAHEQNEGESGLADHENALEEGSAGSGAAGTGPKGLGGLGFGSNPSGSSAEESSGEQGEGEGKSEHLDRGARVNGKAKCVGKSPGKEERSASIGKEESGETAEDSKKKTFGEKLADDSAARSAEGCANRHFEFPLSAADEEQVGDIGAGDQQNEAGNELQQAQIGSVLGAHEENARTPGSQNHVGFGKELLLLLG